MSEDETTAPVAVPRDESAWHIPPVGPRQLLVVWAIPALLETTEAYFLDAAEGHPVSFVRRLVLYLAVWYVWAAAAPAVFWLVRHKPLRRGMIVRRLAPYLALCVGVIVVQAAVWTTGSRVILTTPAPLSAPTMFWHALLAWLPMMFMIYWAVVITGQWLESTRREARRTLEATQLAAQLAQAQLHALRMQLHPHFLFNALNTIAVLVREHDTEMAVGLIAELGDVLRQVLRTAAVQEVSLAEELDFTRRYLGIEQVRFADRLQVTWEHERETLDAAVPHLVLQPLVENALRHGIARLPGGGRLTLGAARRGDRLRLWVRNDGPAIGAALRVDDDAGDGVEHDGAASTSTGDAGGIGLANTRARLRTLYGDSAWLRVGDVPDGVCALLELPWRAAPVASSTPADADIAWPDDVSDSSVSIP